MLKYQYTDTELKKILATLIIIVDTREQKNDHILNYLLEKKIDQESKKLDVGDYGAKIPANPDMGIFRDLYLSTAIERKNSIDELAQTIKDEARWEHELVRSKKLDYFSVVVEDDYLNLITGNYRSQYDTKALQGRINSYEAQFGFTTAFITKELVPHYIVSKLYYRARHALKTN